MRSVVAALSLVALGAAEEEAGVQETCQSRGADSKGHALLQTSRHKSVLAEIPTELSGLSTRGEAHLPLCHPTIVDDTCQLLSGAGPDDDEATTVSSSLLSSLLSANEVDMAAAWGALGLAEDQAVRCEDLCTSVLNYVSAEGGVLPPDSDTACYNAGGRVVCDADVSPESLVKKVAAFEGGSPDDGEMIADDMEPDATTADGKPLTARPLGGKVRPTPPQHVQEDAEDRETFVPYTVWEVALRIASFFRIYPARPGAPEKVTLLQESAEARATAASVASYDAQARAWISVVLRQMNARQTSRLQRKWFGGSGGKSESQVRSRILRTMNFVERELLDGVHYIYPAENAKKTGCQGAVAAYVWKGHSSQDYLETTFPSCNNGGSDPWNEPCAVDRSGRFVVYLCNGWATSDEAFKIAALIHEAAHHTGPVDKTYADDAMQRLSQIDQLNNAAQYEKFARNIAEEAWGCSDTDGACSYYKKNGYCSRSNVANVCRFTCGLCSFSGSPGGGSAPAPPAPRPPSGGSSGGACVDKDPNCGFYAKNGYCSTDNIKKQCRNSCNICSGGSAPAPPAPRPPSGGSSGGACVDKDSNCGFYAKNGYCSTDNIKKQCRKSCNICSGGSAPAPAPAPAPSSGGRWWR